MNRTILFDGAILKALALIIMIKRNYFSNLIYRSIISFKIVEIKKPTKFYWKYNSYLFLKIMLYSTSMKIDLTERYKIQTKYIKLLECNIISLSNRQVLF